jgi:prevent-host-death family protein
VKNDHLDGHLREFTMGAYSVAKAKAQLSALLQAVELGEEVTITRRGVAVAVVLPVRKASFAINWDRIRTCQQRTKPAKQTTKHDWAVLMHEMRDE